MKKIFLIAGVSCMAFVHAQFKVQMTADGNLKGDEAYFYKLDGSKDILISKENRKGNSWTVKYPENYMGMMKIYFPSINSSLNFISENKDVDIDIKVKNDKIDDVVYHDEANRLMNEVQDYDSKKEYILPALYQMTDYYKPSSEFYQALNKEIGRLSGDITVNASQHPFIAYYQEVYSRYVQKQPGSTPTQDDIISFFVNTNDMLETSSLLRPILMNFLNTKSNVNNTASIDKLLSAVNVETSRGQNILSEMIEIFDTYSMTDLKNRYLNQAKSLKCTINDRLSNTISSNDNVNIGAVFANADLAHPVHTKAKTLYDIKADRKIIVFWSSTCSHCEKELPQFIPYYQQLKKDNVDIIAFSLDSNEAEYRAKAENYPWISASELRGWYSSYSDQYNVHATPTYFILDKNNKILAKPDHFNDVAEFLGLK